MTEIVATEISQNKRPLKKQSLPFREFIVLTALMIALVALSTDMMLPALPEIGRDLGVVRANDNQLILAFLFFGLAVGQIAYGPVSDSIGRKPAIYAGLVLFIFGCLLSIFATNFQVMLAGRLLQGIGVAGPRSVMVALVRDLYEGRAMARVMSFVMAVFILVPVIAPTIGQGILLVAHWRVIFMTFLGLAVIMLTWFALRQPETLPPSLRTPFALGRVFRAIREVCTHRIAFGYLLAAGLIAGAFIGFLNSAQQIFQGQYGLGTQFPLYFAILALASGVASFLNGQLVMRYGMRTLTTWATITMAGLALIFYIIAYTGNGTPSLWLTILYFMLTFFTVGILFGNLNALAMEPLGHIAGVGSAVVGSFSTLLSTLIGGLIGQFYNDTLFPLVGGFAIVSILSLGVMWWAEAKSSPL